MTEKVDIQKLEDIIDHISMKLHNKQMELHQSAEKELDQVEKAVLKREKDTVVECMNIVAPFTSIFTPASRTECCDEKLRQKGSWGPSFCPGCGEETPETYEISKKQELEEVIEQEIPDKNANTGENVE